jgi:hypothetical protein
MAVTLTQQPDVIAFSQSPMVFTVAENGDEITSSSYQYICELTYGRGDSLDASENPNKTYILEKYPNESGVGMFDVSKILNSTFQELIAINQSQTLPYDIKFYGRWREGNIFVTGSNLNNCCRLAMDAWHFTNESIYSGLANPSEYPYYPLMTDGPVTQSIKLDDYGYMSMLSLYGWTYNVQDKANKVIYESNIGSGSVSFSDATSSYDLVRKIGVGPQTSYFPQNLNDPNLEWYTIQAFNKDDAAVNESIRFEVKCPTKYDNIRIRFKNRWGGFDNFDFDLVSRESFQTSTKQYRRQMGQWNAPTMDGYHYEPNVQNYNTDVKQTLKVNSDWVSEDFNNFFKQLLVSDEIWYEYYDELLQGIRLRSLTPIASNVQFKTQDVDKLIQYQFEFQIAEEYKLQF